VRRIIVAASACLLLGGCSGGADGDAPAARGTSAPTLTLPTPSSAVVSNGTTAPSRATPQSTAVINDRGNVVEALGQQAGIRAPDGQQAVVFAVDAVVIDPPCSGAQQPANGHYLGVRVRVTTGDLGFLGGSWSMSADDFAVAGPDGDLRFDLGGDGGATCLRAAERFPTTPLEPHRQYVGTVVLDSPLTSGTLVFSTPALQGSGWEWRF
jgi:hypothetical protein